MLLISLAKQTSGSWHKAGDGCMDTVISKGSGTRYTIWP